MTAEKRRASTRLREPLPKRQATLKTPLVEKPVPNPPAKKHTPEPQLDPELLIPNKLVDTAALPTLPKDHVITRPSSYWQSVAESGILAASLIKSRQRWVSGCFLEKYWSKSTYKKKKEEKKEAANEPDKAASKDPRPPMTKVGTCKLIVEPHIFDVTIFVVREPTPQTPLQTDRPFVQYGPTSQTIQPSPQPFGRPSPISNPQFPTAPSPHPTASQPTTLAHISRPPSTPQIHSQPHPAVVPAPKVAAQSKPAHPPAVQNAPNRPPLLNPPPKPASNTATDPVIHMLAQRASADNGLKQVMKIVASGQASQEQLEYFQRHIDELTAIVKSKQAEERKTAAQAIPVPVPVSTAPVRPPPHQNMHYQSAQRFGTPIAAGPSRQLFTPNSAQARPKSSIPPPLHVLLEFSISSADRFLFPRNAILEFTGTNTLLASFLVVKKPSEIQDLDIAEPKKYARAKKEDPAKVEALVELPKSMSKAKAKALAKEKEDADREVYQPVTVRLESPSDPAVFNVISRVVAPVDDVRKYMTETAEKYDMVAPVRLAMRLAKEKKGDANA